MYAVYPQAPPLYHSDYLANYDWSRIDALSGWVNQADILEAWLETVLSDYADHILDFTALEAQVWGKLRVPNPHNALDKQIAATALAYGLTLVTRNVKNFVNTGVSLLNPFEEVGT